MRTLYYVPIIHTSADMGSLAKAVTACGISRLGEKMWQAHVALVQRFWDTIARYVAGLPAHGLKIYQDGLVADGEIGLKIVAAGVQSGSRNYEIVEALIKRGAEIVPTEDFKLVLQERDRLFEIIEAPTRPAKILASLKYRLLKRRLLSQRDEFIARRIAATLAPPASAAPKAGFEPGGTGILFIGAYHRVRRRLPRDIKIIEVKAAEKVRQYQELLPFADRQRQKFAGLSRYLAAPVELAAGPQYAEEKTDLGAVEAAGIKVEPSLSA